MRTPGGSSLRKAPASYPSLVNAGCGLMFASDSPGDAPRDWSPGAARQNTRTAVSRTSCFAEVVDEFVVVIKAFFVCGDTRGGQLLHELRARALRLRPLEDAAPRRTMCVTDILRKRDPSS